MVAELVYLKTPVMTAVNPLVALMHGWRGTRFSLLTCFGFNDAYGSKSADMIP